MLPRACACSMPSFQLNYSYIWLLQRRLEILTEQLNGTALPRCTHGRGKAFPGTLCFHMRAT